MIIQRHENPQTFFPAGCNARIARAILAILSALSLLLCGMTVALWIASYFVRAATPQGFRLLLVRIGEGDDCLFLRPGILEHAILGSLDHKWWSEEVIHLWAPALLLLLAAICCLLIRRSVPRDL